MGNVNEPYMATNRFEVAFTSTPPRYRLELTIVGEYGRYLLIYRRPLAVARRPVDANASSSVLRQLTDSDRCWSGNTVLTVNAAVAAFRYA